ncbi:4'-phosphopantetheinyl transferase family protein [Pedobacter africanus]|uniref:4'-phosphopantetheinyl transferase n=1 Tax=Pedobacter africanus TaxID=151894 RepID=A0A1W2DFN7_9SPHI|nr:4'-phosphopantetheinyl transferase superfamily protein [Pedobacter africanus]SMC96255.1 4'-phosphopantetheinyl transferase [Pedobacter africanus]
MNGPELQSQVNWKPLPVQWNLDLNENHVFKVAIDRYFSRMGDLYSKTLTAGEVLKASKYLNQSDQQRYLVSKYLLRDFLGGFLNCAAGDIKFNLSAKKKPYTQGIEFNVSHTGNYVFLAFSSSPVGIDAEMLNPGFDFELLLPELFDTEEIRFINSNAAVRSQLFYMLWTRKEALLKASGEGLTDQLFLVNILSDTPSRIGQQYQLHSFIQSDCLFTLALSNHNPCSYWTVL